MSPTLQPPRCPLWYIISVMNWKRLFSYLGFVVLLALVAGWVLAPRARGITPQDSPLHGRQPLQITFNRPMDNASTERSLSIDPPREGEITWGDGGRTLTFTPHSPWPSDSQITIRINSQARSRHRLPLINPRTWQLTVSPYLLTYLYPADTDSNLYSLNVQSGESQALTDHANGVLDYDISPDGLTIYYSRVNNDGTSAVYALDRLTGEERRIFLCRQALCRDPQISPEAEAIAYERIPQDAEQNPDVYLYSFAESASRPIMDSEHYLENPSWSSQGWLAVYDRTSEKFRFLQPQSGDTASFQNEAGGDGTWTPDGLTFITTTFLDLDEELAPRHLLAFNLLSGETRDLTQDTYLEDANPAHAPRGDLLAFGRKSLQPEQWTPGRQLWVMEGEGTQAYPLTEAVDYHHTAFTWHPQGDRLAYVRYNQAQLAEAPEIWLVNLVGGQHIRLIINAFAPRWIP